MRKLLLSIGLAVGLFFAAGATPAQAEPWHHHGYYGWRGAYRPYGWYGGYRGWYGGYRPYYWGSYYRPWVAYDGPRYYSYPAYYYNPYPVVTSYYYGYPGVGFYLGY